jgi:phenylalanyl-tRNA synthetase alpha chain
MTTSSSTPAGDLTSQVLHILSKQSPILTAEAFPSVAYEDIKAALTRLAGRSMVTYETIEREDALLEPEAEQIAAQGSHEARVFEAVRQAMEGLTIPDLEKAIGDKTVTKLGQGKAFREKWIVKGKDGKLTATVRNVRFIRLSRSVANHRLRPNRPTRLPTQHASNSSRSRKRRLPMPKPSSSSESVN